MLKYLTATEKNVMLKYDAEIKACKSQIDALEIMLSKVDELEKLKFTKHLQNKINKLLKDEPTRVFLRTKYTDDINIMTNEHSVEHEGTAYYSIVFRERSIIMNNIDDDKYIPDGELTTALLNELKYCKKSLIILERNNDYDIIKQVESRRKEIVNEIERFNENLDVVAKIFYKI